jgi:hypothetical protein
MTHPDAGLLLSTARFVPSDGGLPDLHSAELKPARQLPTGQRNLGWLLVNFLENLETAIVPLTAPEFRFWKIQLGCSKAPIENSRLPPMRPRT